MSERVFIIVVMVVCFGGLIYWKRSGRDLGTKDHVDRVHRGNVPKFVGDAGNKHGEDRKKGEQANGQAAKDAAKKVNANGKNVKGDNDDDNGDDNDDDNDEKKDNKGDEDEEDDIEDEDLDDYESDEEDEENDDDDYVELQQSLEQKYLFISVGCLSIHDFSMDEMRTNELSFFPMLIVVIFQCNVTL